MSPISTLLLLLLVVALASTVTAIVQTPPPKPCVTCHKWAKNRQLCNAHADSCQFIDRTKGHVKTALISRYGTAKNGYKACRGDFGVSFLE